MARLVPGVRSLLPAAPASRITARHLLSHSAGLANPIPVRWIHPAEAPAPEPEALLSTLLARHRRLRFEPGARSSYSNLGVLVLGSALANAAGRPFTDLVRAVVLEPLRMTRTGFAYSAEMEAEAATGYHPRWSPMRLLLPRWVLGPAAGRWLSSRRFLPDGAPYGGLVGSLDDSARFLRMHLRGGELDGRRVLSPESVAAMRDISVAGRTYDLGLGWFRPSKQRDADPPFVEHLGGGCRVLRPDARLPDHRHRGRGDGQRGARMAAPRWCGRLRPPGVPDPSTHEVRAARRAEDVRPFPPEVSDRTIIVVARQARRRPSSPRSRALVGAGVLVLVAAGSVLGFLAWRALAAPRSSHPALQPRVAALATGSGTAVSDGDLVPAGTPLRMTFATRMRTSTVQLLANQVPLALRWAADGTAAALDVASLRLGPVELVVPTGGRDGAGLTLPPWRLAFSWALAVPAPTVPLPAPALVQVPNDASARDQAGLQSAAIVYEYLTEGGITRFTAIYTRAPDAIGPVRSGRLISFALTRRYHGLLLASGLSEGSDAVLRANPVPHVFDTGGGVFSRTGSRQPPNNLFTNGERVRQGIAGAGLASYALERGSVPIRSGPAATTVAVSEHGSVYTFDPATWTYTKRVDGRTLADAATGQPLRIQLLVVMHTTAAPTAYVEDVNGAHGLDIDMASGGRADFWFDGFRASGRWSTRGPDSPPTFELDGGGVVSPPPLTWIDVVTT